MSTDEGYCPICQKPTVILHERLDDGSELFYCARHPEKFRHRLQRAGQRTEEVPQ